MSTELLVVGGERRAATEGKTFDVIEPGTGESMAEVAEAGPEDARRAVDTAVRAFEEGPWPRTSATARGRVLLRASLTFAGRFHVSPVQKRTTITNRFFQMAVTGGTARYRDARGDVVFNTRDVRADEIFTIVR